MFFTKVGIRLRRSQTYAEIDSMPSAKSLHLGVADLPAKQGSERQKIENRSNRGHVI